MMLSCFTTDSATAPYIAASTYKSRMNRLTMFEAVHVNRYRSCPPPPPPPPPPPLTPPGEPQCTPAFLYLPLLSKQSICMVLQECVSVQLEVKCVFGVQCRHHCHYGMQDQHQWASPPWSPHLTPKSSPTPPCERLFSSLSGDPTCLALMVIPVCRQPQNCCTESW